jgi:FMN phosphatase YigB (HAD superfamily)
MKRAIVLDVDGVILRSPKPLAKVAQNCCTYVSHKLNMAPREAVRVNKVLYSEFGHTLLGLNRVYAVRATPLEFTNHVYDMDTLTELAAAHHTDPDFESHAAAARDLFQKCKEEKIPIYLFSNAPALWCIAVAYMKGLHKLGFKEEHVIGCGDMLKPEPAIYERVESVLSNVEEILYVDDSLKNIVPTLGRPRWRPVHFVPDYSRHHPYIHSSRMRTISHLSDLI